MNVYQKLSAARMTFHKMELKKSGHNKFAGYHYFELGDFVVPALGAMKEVGLTPIISFSKDLAEMKLVNDDKPEEFITITSPMSEANLKGCHPVQNLGAVESYIRRYLWVAALEIVEHDALDQPINENNVPDGKNKKIVITPLQGIAENIPPEEMQYLKELAVELIANVAEGQPKQALDRVAAEKLEADQQSALWSLLDSKTRSAIKKAKEL